MRKGNALLVILSAMLLTGCSEIGMGTEAAACPPNAVIDWVDVLMINGITYASDVEGLNDGEVRQGELIGEVMYTMDGHACSDHQLRDGDAAFLSTGTDIYEVAGYASDFRVLAGGKVYQVEENQQAATISELYDIEGKVSKLSLASPFDGSHITDFTPEETAAFLEQFLELEYVGFDAVYPEIESDTRAFLRIHLDDGSSFQIVYWPEENVLKPGARGTAELQEIVQRKVETVQ